MRVLITGATGFVGRGLTRCLGERPRFMLRAASRNLPPVRDSRAEYVLGADLSSADPDWSQALSGVDVVVHLAARVHVMRDTAPDSLAAFRRANVAGTMALARQAAAAGVGRFILLSSIKVNGEQTAPGRPYHADDPSAPRDPYGVSKLEAEQGLRQLASSSAMQFVIIRPPLVYGPGVGANFLRMLRWVASGRPLPLGAIHNKRSLVALGNLVDLIATCLDHPAAANRVLLVSDGEDLSTTELLRRLGRLLGRPATLIPIPAAVLTLGASLVGKADIARRLCGSLQVDSAPTRALLSWQPPLSVDRALELVVRDFVARTAE